MANILYSERAFLQLTARRILGYSREAESRGEAYHDIGPLVPLQCGVRVKYRFEKSPGGYTPVVTFRKSSTYTNEELLDLASELLDGKAVLRKTADPDLEYVRSSDFTAEN